MDIASYEFIDGELKEVNKKNREPLFQSEPKKIRYKKISKIALTGNIVITALVVNEYQNNAYNGAEKFKTIYHNQELENAQVNRIHYEHENKNTFLPIELISDKPLSRLIEYNVSMPAPYNTHSYDLQERNLNSATSTAIRKAIKANRKGDQSMDIVNKIEKKINNSYKVASFSFATIASVSLASIAGLNFIPSPIDNVIFFASLAGALGFLIDDLKRKKFDG